MALHKGPDHLLQVHSLLCMITQTVVLGLRNAEDVLTVCSGRKGSCR